MKAALQDEFSFLFNQYSKEITLILLCVIVLATQK